MNKTLIFLLASAGLTLAGCGPLNFGKAKPAEPAPVAAPSAPEPAAIDAKLSLANLVQLPPVPAADVCEDAASRDAFNTAMESASAKIGSAQAQYQEQHEAQLDSYAEQLISAGAWTADDREAFMAKMMEDPKFIALMEKAMNNAMDMMESMTGVAGLDTDKPDAGTVCKANLIMRTGMEKVIADTDAQWSYMESLYVAEAAAKGVTLTSE
jgi:hypothetical protein